MNVPAFFDDRYPGHTRLWIVFWIHGVLFSHVLFGGILLLYPRVGTPAFAAALVGFMVYTALITRSIWRNAFNVSDEIRGHIARRLTVAWALNAVLVSGFLLIGHFQGAALPFL